MCSWRIISIREKMARIWEVSEELFVSHQKVPGFPGVDLRSSGNFQGSLGKSCIRFALQSFGAWEITSTVLKIKKMSPHFLPVLVIISGNPLDISRKLFPVLVYRCRTPQNIQSCEPFFPLQHSKTPDETPKLSKICPSDCFWGFQSGGLKFGWLEPPRTIAGTNFGQLWGFVGRFWML